MAYLIISSVARIHKNYRFRMKIVYLASLYLSYHVRPNKSFFGHEVVYLNAWIVPPVRTNYVFRLKMVNLVINIVARVHTNYIIRL